MWRREVTCISLNSGETAKKVRNCESCELLFGFLPLFNLFTLLCLHLFTFSQFPLFSYQEAFIPLQFEEHAVWLYSLRTARQKSVFFSINYFLSNRQSEENRVLAKKTGRRVKSCSYYIREKNARGEEPVALHKEGSTNEHHHNFITMYYNGTIPRTNV